MVFAKGVQADLCWLSDLQGLAVLLLLVVGGGGGGGGGGESFIGLRRVEGEETRAWVLWTRD